MPYVIAEPCVGCKDEACVEVCPVCCIHDAGTQFVIDPIECTDCRACVSVCPVEAIYHEDDIPPQWVQYGALNAAFFKTHDAVDAGEAQEASW